MELPNSLARWPRNGLIALREGRTEDEMRTTTAESYCIHCPHELKGPNCCRRRILEMYFKKIVYFKLINCVTRGNQVFNQSSELN